MNIKLSIFLLFVLQTAHAQSDSLNDLKLKNINHVITVFQQKNMDSISKLIQFPLKREYPIPSVKDEAELNARFHEIFDPNFLDTIANSTPEQWSEVGWRGIMFESGLLWMNSDDGKIIAMNYQSTFEKNQLIYLIEVEKQHVHPSLKTFESPTYKIKTKNYLIRIDELHNGKYRYASWKIVNEESSEPDLVLINGELEFQGSGGNHVISFSNGHYVYKIHRNFLRELNSPEILLLVEKNGKIILNEGGELIAE